MQGDSFVPPVWTYLTYTLSSIFPFPESIEYFNTLCVSVLLIKKEFFSSLSRYTMEIHLFLWVYSKRTKTANIIYLSQEKFGTPRPDKPPNTPQVQILKAKTFCYFWLTFHSQASCFSLPLALALSIGQLHDFCRLLIHCNTQSHFLLLYSEQSTHSPVLLPSLFPFDFHTIYRFADSIMFLMR